MKPYGMTRRLILSLTATLIAFWLIAVTAGVLVMQDEFGEIFDSSLKETAERLTPLVVDDILQSDTTAVPRRLQNLTASPESSYLTYQVRDAKGGVILHSEDIPPTPFAAPLKRGFWENDAARFYTVPAVNDTIFVQVADDNAHREEAALEGGLALLLPLLVLIPVGIFVVWFVVRLSLRPVNELRQAIASKDGGNLAPIAPIALPRELQPIIHSVNRLLARLRSTLAAEREFTANSAHELRTPLAGALAQTQLLKKHVRGEEAKSRTVHIEQSLQKLSGLVEKLMQLARAEAGLGSADEVVDLAKVLDVVVGDFQRASTAPDRINYVRDAGAKLKRRINEDIFAIALRNLIENALHHGNQNEPVLVHLERGGKIRIANGSPTLGREEIVRIQKRFSRGETSRGSGLGLAIVIALAAQMNATLNLLSPATGRSDGFEAVLTFNGDRAEVG
ncbi:two-component system, OmpR family, sensor kinase [Phyllobacterium sp. YR620]|uniref:sensor histidine kinase n=1 Tax=Phyllobacterium sp. YR620 TaxID=1881066 RepID=UPI00088D3C3C|nr:histidine kinase dimerization/phospho-acceptor domain-containing protein [Phyllobacterium sp. YR620]SDO92644.1 two-component system, OmpR family, sensor kinase [Phyllobacterium sp. YR620]